MEREKWTTSYTIWLNSKCSKITCVPSVKWENKLLQLDDFDITTLVFPWDNLANWWPYKHDGWRDASWNAHNKARRCENVPIASLSFAQELWSVEILKKKLSLLTSDCCNIRKKWLGYVVLCSWNSLCSQVDWSLLGNSQYLPLFSSLP